MRLVRAAAHRAAAPGRRPCGRDIRNTVDTSAPVGCQSRRRSGWPARCRPGARSRDIYDFAQGAFREAGYDAALNLVGHSVGPWWHQQAPFIVRDAEDILEEGMVIALEPHADFWHLQDLVLISGPRGARMTRVLSILGLSFI